VLHRGYQNSDRPDEDEEHPQRCRGSRLVVARRGLRRLRQQAQEQAKAGDDETERDYGETGAQPCEKCALCGKEDSRVGLAHCAWTEALRTKLSGAERTGNARRRADGLSEGLGDIASAFGLTTDRKASRLYTGLCTGGVILRRLA